MDMSNHRLLAVIPLSARPENDLYEVYFATDQEVAETAEEEEEARSYNLSRSVLGSDRLWISGNLEVHYYAVRSVLVRVDSLFAPECLYSGCITKLAKQKVPWLSSPEGSYPLLQIYSGCKYETFVSCIQFAGGQVYIPERDRRSWKNI